MAARVNLRPGAKAPRKTQLDRLIEATAEFCEPRAIAPVVAAIRGVDDLSEAEAKAWLLAARKPLRF